MRRIALSWFINLSGFAMLSQDVRTSPARNEVNLGVAVPCRKPRGLYR
jgi:hypothetical protein